MRLVIIESPYAGDVERNLNYLSFCLMDCLGRGEAPLAGHGLYTSCLDDKQPVDRKLGIEAGLAWGALADAIVVYTDLGSSLGMENAIAHYRERGKIIEYRKLTFAKRAEFMG